MKNNGHPQKKGLFSLGQIVATPGALEALADHPGLALKLLARHVTGDWAELCDEDREENRIAIEQGFRVFTSYTIPGDTKIWIITEADRSVTTLLLPEEY